MKYTEETFLETVKKQHGDRYKFIGRFKGTEKPLLIEDKYGLIQLPQAYYLFRGKPGIMNALNKTEYFMNQLRESNPELAQELTPLSEYETQKKEMLFRNQFGIVSISPDALLHGHVPNIRSAVNRKDYFKNQLLYLYQDYDYDFIVTSTNRHEGRVTLICPIHGEQSVDTDGIFLGKGCPMCNNHISKSDILYLVKLENELESFYKLGISYLLNNKVRRFKDYESLGYKVTPITIRQFNSFEECINCETKLKRLIRPFLYYPKIWANKKSKECFSDSMLDTILFELNQDIVSTSIEIQSSLKEDGQKLTTSAEENVV